MGRTEATVYLNTTMTAFNDGEEKRRVERAANSKYGDTVFNLNGKFYAIIQMKILTLVLSPHIFVIVASSTRQTITMNKKKIMMREREKEFWEKVTAAFQ